MSVVPMVRLVRESENHPCFPQPANRDVRIWRYMKVPHFAQLVTNGQLWLSRSDNLGDPCEGHRPFGDAAIFEAARERMAAEGRLHEYPVVRASWEYLDRKSREELFVSCWMMNETDNMGMWKLYCPPGGVGIAIQTTYARLDAALPFKARGDRNVMLGMVTYGDFEAPEFRSDPSNIYSPFMLKKAQYSHEKEVRVICDDRKAEARLGITIPVDVGTLIERVILGPAVGLGTGDREERDSEVRVLIPDFEDNRAAGEHGLP